MYQLDSIPRSKRRWLFAWVVGFGIVTHVVWNLHWIDQRIPHIDEYFAVDTALHGTLRLWADVLPGYTRARADEASHATKPGHSKLLHFVLQRFGVGLTQARLPGLIAGLFGLWILIGVAILCKLPRAVPWTLYVFGFSYFFHVIAASARQDSFIFLAICVHAAWFLAEPSRRSSCLAGLIGGIAFSFHPNAVFLYVAAPVTWLILSPRPKIQNPMLAWWFIGLALGLSVSFCWTDWDHALPYFQAATRPIALDSQPPIFRFLTNPINLVRHSLLLISQPWLHSNSWFHAGWGLVFAGVLSQLRRYRTLSVPVRAWLVFGVGLSASWALFSCSETSSYSFLFFPFFLIQAVCFSSAVAAGQERVDAGDWSFLFCAQIAAHQQLMGDAEIKAFSVAILSFVPGLLVLPPIWGILCVGTFVLSVVYEKDMWLWAMYSLRTDFHFYPWRSIGGFLVLLIGFHVPILVRVAQATSGVRALRRTSWPIALTVVLAGWWLSDLRIFENKAAEAKVSAAASRELQQIRSEKKVLGPQSLIFYQPDLPAQSVEALFYAREYYRLPFAFIMKAIAIGRPSLILWPESNLKEMQSFVSQNKNLISAYSASPAVKFPFGNFIPIRLRFQGDALNQWGPDFANVRQRVRSRS
jgi:hypothetical protein